MKRERSDTTDPRDSPRRRHKRFVGSLRHVWGHPREDRISYGMDPATADRLEAICDEALEQIEPLPEPKVTWVDGRKVVDVQGASPGQLPRILAKLKERER